jgi:hemerythrin superfamily protein
MTKKITDKSDLHYRDSANKLYNILLGFAVTEDEKDCVTWRLSEETEQERFERILEEIKKRYSEVKG